MKRVFIDCGANTCNVLRRNMERFPDFEFYAFEPQPELTAGCIEIIKQYPKSKVTFFNKAVWVANERMPLYLARRWGPNYKGASTLLSGHKKTFANIDYSHPVYVDAIDFSEWLGANFCPDDYVVVKMDIEGAEYEVLEKIIRDGNHRIVKKAIVEFHRRLNDSITKQRHDTLVATIKTFAKLIIWH